MDGWAFCGDIVLHPMDRLLDRKGWGEDLREGVQQFITWIVVYEINRRIVGLIDVLSRDCRIIAKIK